MELEKVKEHQGKLTYLRVIHKARFIRAWLWLSDCTYILSYKLRSRNDACYFWSYLCCSLPWLLGPITYVIWVLMQTDVIFS